MSPPWKSELRIRLSRTACRAAIAAPWSRAVGEEVRVEGEPARSLADAAAALQARDGARLPTSAAMLVPDELAYVTVLAPVSGWAAARREARAQFERMLGRDDIVVQVSALPKAAGWLAGAIDAKDLDAWRDTLAGVGVALTRVGLSLLDDLRAIASQVGDHGVLAMMRDEGISVIRIDDGVPVSCVWERCDQHAMDCIERRLQAAQCADSAAAGGTPTLSIAFSSEAQRDAWTRIAQGHRWRLLMADRDAIEPMKEPWQ